MGQYLEVRVKLLSTELLIWFAIRPYVRVSVMCDEQMSAMVIFGGGGRCRGMGQMSHGCWVQPP